MIAEASGGLRRSEPSEVVVVLVHGSGLGPEPSPIMRAPDADASPHRPWHSPPVRSRPVASKLDRAGSSARSCGAVGVLVGALAALATAGCRETIVDHVPLVLTLPEAAECRAAAGPITLTALGDFPTTEGLVIQLDTTVSSADAITRFSESSLAFSASAPAATGAWTAFGWASRDSLAREPTLVLRPLGRSCPLGDSEARQPEGAAVAVVDESRVMIVGGLDDTDQASRRVALLDVRRERVEVMRVERSATIAFASAALVPEGDAVLVTGGAGSRNGEGGDTWQRVPFDGGPATFGSLDARRRDHTSLAVDGPVHGVLLLGGTGAGGDVVESIEWVDPGRDTGSVLGAALVPGRRTPLARLLDASHVVVAGGRDARGAVVGDAYVLDLDAETLTPLPTPSCAPDWIALLDDGRIVWGATCADPAMGGAVRTTASVILPRTREIAERVVDVPPLLDPVTTALPSGRLLVEGHRGDGTRQAYVVDVGAATVASAATSRLPRSLVTLSDGATVELAIAGASVRRDERGTPFDAAPPTYLFALDRDAFSLDAATRWAPAADGLTVASGVDAARLDLRSLRLARFSVTVSASGPFRVVLTGAHGEEVAVIGGAAGERACPAPEGDAPLTIARDGDTLSLSRDGASRSCVISGLPERVGIGLVAEQGATLRSLALSRLAR